MHHARNRVLSPRRWGRVECRAKPKVSPRKGCPLMSSEELRNDDTEVTAFVALLVFAVPRSTQIYLLASYPPAIVGPA